MKSLLRTIFTSKKTTALAVGILVVGAVTIAQLGSTENPEDASQETATTTARSVSLLSVTEAAAGGQINTTGTVESQSQAGLAAEGSGVVNQVNVEIGDTVNRGDLLVRLSDADEQAAVAQAAASLQAQQARLAELLAGSRPAELANAAASVETARSTLLTAQEDFFNTDLQAYVAETDVYSQNGSFEQPTISGVYRSNELGEYRIELYRSGSQSGYSFRYSGLESGVGPVSTEVPQPLGNRGLYVEFPDDYATSYNLEWVVPVPNTRSTQYSQIQSNLKKAQQGLAQAENNLALAREGTRSEQVQAQQAAVAQAEAGLAAARARLQKKQIRAPFSGEVTDVSASIGQQVSPGQSLVELVDINSLQVTTYVSSQAARSISAGNTVVINGDVSGEVTAVAAAVGQQSGKVAVKVRITDSASSLIVGDFVSVDITTEAVAGGDAIVPLAAVKNDTQGAYVLTIGADGTTQRVAVETGSIRGEKVTVTAGLDGVTEIISDIRSLSPGQRVSGN